MNTFTQTHLPDGIIELTYTGVFTVADWKTYQTTMLQLLNDASPQKLYILSNFTGIESFSREILAEVGMAPHLTHPGLGMLVLLGGTALQNFVMQLTQLRARQTSRDMNMRVHSDRDRALEVLRHFQALHQHPVSAASDTQDAPVAASTPVDTTIEAISAAEPVPAANPSEPTPTPDASDQSVTN